MSSNWRKPYAGGYRTATTRYGNMDHALPKSLPPPMPSQTKILEIHDASKLHVANDGKPVITNVELVGSFSWKDSANPIILIPGKPPKWQPPNETRILKPDSGIYYHDSNSARYPSFPMEPSIKAIEKHKPGFSFMDVDLVTCDHCLSRLFAFVRGEELTFRFGVELIGSTLFLVRKTNLPRETIDDIRGYGHSFPEAYTTWDNNVRGSSRNQRLLNYDFAGLNCVVRFGSDGYLAEKLQQTSTSITVEETEVGSELDKISILRLLASTPDTSEMLEVQEAGELIPQEAVFDLKTRSKQKMDTVSIDTFLHNIWINRVPNFILAFHERGRFQRNDIHVADVRDRVQEWEAKNAKDIKELSQVLQKLISIAQLGDRTTFEIRREGKGALQIWSEVTGWSALPSSMKSLFVAEMESINCDKVESSSDGGNVDDDHWLKL